MHLKPIIILPGQPNSIFFEIFFKSLQKKIKSPIILVCCLKLFIEQAKKYKFNNKYNLINSKTENIINLKNRSINIIDIRYKRGNTNQIQIRNSRAYLEKCFKVAFVLLKKKVTYKLLNGPINKKNFLTKRYLGITEYISNYFNTKKFGMLIYNKKLSVCPLTTHLPVKLISKKISKKLIREKLILINNFYLDRFKFIPKIGVTGLNPHCESILEFNEDKKIIAPVIKSMKTKGISCYGPYSADTIFLKQNRKKFNVILGMYHDQVLTPLKTLFEYDAINITMGLSFLRVSPDHGPNDKMINKNLSNPTSIARALEFLDQN
jgi:4-hydroxy-L-threonine phosphate dehydrogenase PdxA